MKRLLSMVFKSLRKSEKAQTAIEFVLIMIFLLLFTALFIKMIPKMAEILKDAVLNTLYANFFCTFN